MERKNYFVENLRKTLREDNNFIPKINKLAHALYSIYRLDVTTHPHPPHSEGLCSYMSGKKNNGSGIGFGFEVPKSYAIVICSAGMVRLSTQNTLCLLQTNNHNKTEKKQQNNEHNTQQKLQKPKTPTLYQNPVCLISHSTLHCHWYINNRSPVSPAGKKSFFFVLADVGFWVQGSGSPGNDVGHGPGATDFLPTPYHSGVNAFNMPRVF